MAWQAIVGQIAGSALSQGGGGGAGGGSGYGSGGPAGASGASSGNNTVYGAPAISGPPLNVADEILSMLGSHENGGAFEATPNRLSSYLSGNSQTGFSVDLGSISGQTSFTTLAAVGIGLVALLGLVLWRRRR